MTSTITELLVAAVALAVPLLLASSGEAVSERAGVLNMSVEAMMLVGCFASVLVAVSIGSVVAGTLAGALAGLGVALVQALLSVGLRADQIVTGIALNTLALAGTTFGARLLLERGATPPGLSRVDIPVLTDLPIVGRALFGQTPLAYALLALAALVAVLASRRTAWGLTIDAVGEDAVMADWAGVPVVRVRVLVVLLVGVSSGLAGSFLALSEVGTFTDNMTNGIGYLAVVAVIAARWRSSWLAPVALVFGVAQALQYTLPALGVGLPVAVLVALPYVLALVAVAGLVTHSRGPSGLTVPFARAAR